ncbi:MAG: DUF3299 domain-containing protein [Cyclobacteriaceae bacterium]
MMICFLVAVLLGFQSSGWETLEDVTFRNSYSSELETIIDIPNFGSQLLSQNGKSIKIRGYYLPFELKNPKGIILSKFPYSSCFFCGGAGLESVAEVHFSTKPLEFHPDEIVTVKGTLQLNQDDFEHLVFIVTHAELATWND